jgi:hypothetical protein
VPAELAIFGAETGEEAGVNYGQPHPQVSVSWAGQRHCAQPGTRNLPEQMCGLPAAWSRLAIAAAGAAATGLRAGAGPAYRRADAATREGGMTAAPLQAKRDAPS